MIAAHIAAVLGAARREGRSWRCRCPLHGGHSLIVREGDRGRVLVTCWGGCDRGEVLAELRRLDLLDLLDGQPTFPPARPATRLPHGDHDRFHDRIARALRIWRGSVAVPDIIARYLSGRSILLDPIPTCLRYHRCCPRPQGEPMPAMVALVEHAAHGIVGIHRTYLTPDYRRHDRATLGPISGGAVRLGMPRVGEWLAIGEGIETTAAVVAACGMPAWAALSAGGLRALILPPEATQIVICADHDANGTGARAAHNAAARWLTEGRRVRIAIPPEPGTDMADVLAAGAAATDLRHVA
jgi:putative DNA primase/helicase